ncbi:hypothetical protein L198_01102 [Cryptococcus wingfieldii CBS 7118]|uniref:Uncharacterized protein n=1 Tax=Cryptococcus wingfieldii CBS 7118 TaxID=1295528 RepID=A0A1E3K3V8_9TREE|nr:hypothetical protein L198_01102 [Cryptococcus wingfieldii CBS 7118]ODO07523.1 hypothetical protein L198_01102 [Cryptococcus wingfieldii CBS 7118]
MSLLARTIRPTRTISAIPRRYLTTTTPLFNTNSTTSTEESSKSDQPKIQTWFLQNKTPSPSQKTTNQIPIHPLPPTAPAAVQAFHAFLTEQAPSEASEVILPETLQFFDTREAVAALEAAELPIGLEVDGLEDGLGDVGGAVKLSGIAGTPTAPGALDLEPAPASSFPRETRCPSGSKNREAYFRKKGSDVGLPEDGDLIDAEEGSGPAWEWVGVVQVKGRGRGVVRRADGVVRRWLMKHPLASHVEPITIENPKTPRIDPDADWSIISVKGTRICLNLLTEAGREKWRLEDLWGIKP